MVLHTHTYDPYDTSTQNGIGQFKYASNISSLVGSVVPLPYPSPLARMYISHRAMLPYLLQFALLRVSTTSYGTCLRWIFIQSVVMQFTMFTTHKNWTFYCHLLQNSGRMCSRLFVRRICQAVSLAPMRLLQQTNKLRMQSKSILLVEQIRALLFLYFFFLFDCRFSRVNPKIDKHI